MKQGKPHKVAALQITTNQNQNRNQTIMAITKKKPTTGNIATSLKKKISQREETGVGPAEDEGAAPAPKAKTKEKVEAVANEILVGLFESYDEKVSEAGTIFIELVEKIQEDQLDRATVVASMMQARGISYENAQAQYSKMKKIFNNEEVLQDLKEGKITLKVARERTKTEQKNPAAAKPEAKEQKYTSTMKAFVAAAKESGFARKEIMVSVEAELKSAGIK